MKAASMTAGVVVLAMALAGGPGCSEKRSELANGTPGTNSTLLIEPNLAVGPVRAGMTVAQVIAELGEPQRLPSNSLEYTRLGFAVMPGPDGKVQVVMCGDVTGINGPFAKAFTGRTKEGIGMFSTRDEIIHAYGDPTASEKMRGGLESLQYEPLGITFTLETGKVHHIIVRLRGPQQPDRTVTLVPAPEPSGQ
jgi:hypothetical protein